MTTLFLGSGDIGIRDAYSVDEGRAAPALFLLFIFTLACLGFVVPLDEAWTQAERATVVDHGGTYLDLNRYLCNGVCGTVIGPYLVYRDRNHLTTTMSAALTPCLAEDLAAAGITWRSV